MTENRPQRVRELFDQAVDLAPADQATFLNAHCPEDDAVRARVEYLLACDARVHAQEGGRGLLDSPLVRSSEQITPTGTPPPASPGPAPMASSPGAALVRARGPARKGGV
jgi:hypothetical protein